MSANPSFAMKVLLVDDDPNMVRQLSGIIEGAFGDRIELFAISDPKEARRWMENNVADILLTDLEMPNVNGLELLRCAKRQHSNAQVLFITGESTLDALSDALEVGATDYLLKPVNQGEVVDLVEDSLKRLGRWRRAIAGALVAS